MEFPPVKAQSGPELVSLFAPWTTDDICSPVRLGVIGALVRLDAISALIRLRLNFNLRAPPDTW